MHYSLMLKCKCFEKRLSIYEIVVIKLFFGVQCKFLAKAANKRALNYKSSEKDFYHFGITLTHLKAKIDV